MGQIKIAADYLKRIDSFKSELFKQKAKELFCLMLDLLNIYPVNISEDTNGDVTLCYLSLFSGKRKVHKRFLYINFFKEEYPLINFHLISTAYMKYMSQDIDKDNISRIEYFCIHLFANKRELKNLYKRLLKEEKT